MANGEMRRKNEFSGKDAKYIEMYIIFFLNITQSLLYILLQNTCPINVVFIDIYSSNK